MASKNVNSEESFYDAEPEPNLYTVDYEANFANKMSVERDKVKLAFRELRESLTAREGELLGLLEMLGQKIGNAIAEKQQQLDKLQRTINDLSISLRDNHMLSTLQETQRPMLRRIGEIRDQCEKLSMVVVNTNMETLQQAIHQFGQIDHGYAAETSNCLDKENSISREEASDMYKGRSNPKWVSSIPNETSFIMKAGLVTTRQLAINRTSGMVAVADKAQERVHIFTEEGDYVQCVKPDIGPPLGVVFACDHLFVTSPDVLVKISTDEWVVKNTHHEANFSLGVLDSWRDNVYVSLPDDRSIAMFSGGDLTHNKLVSLEVESVNEDRRLGDFKVVGDSFFVLFRQGKSWLSEFNSFSCDEYPLQEYTMDGRQVRSIVSGGILKAPAYFCFDDFGNILVTTLGTFHDEILILSEDGTSIGSVGTFWLLELFQPTKGVCNPSGIVCNSKGNILVACTFTNYPVLQAY